MANDQKTTLPQVRDGTSQSGRILPELDPQHVRVDERTTRDLLAFVQAYARELKYFGIDDPDQAQGDWSGFVGSIDLDLAARYTDEPEKFAPEAASAYARPHVALLLTFLKLLENTRAQLNTLTGRHLEFFYRDVLRMIRKRAVADQVHVLVELDGRTDAVQLPPGTPLRAGKDRLGRDLHYRTANELIANQVQVAQVSSLHTEIRHIGIREASRQYLLRGTHEEAFVAMLRIALGQPNPGDPLPVPIYAGVPPAGSEVSFANLVAARDLLAIVDIGLGMPMFADFRELMRLKRLREKNDAADWQSINRYLVEAGRNRNAAFAIDPVASSNFEANLAAALGKDLAKLFDGLPEVDTVEEAYAAYCKRPKDVEAFLEVSLSPLTLANFKAMMDIKVLKVDNQWEAINQLLEAAGKRKDSTFQLPPEVRASHDFHRKLAAAVETVAPNFDFPGDIDACFEAFLAIERYFFMSAENFTFIMSVAAPQNAWTAEDRDWQKVYEIVGAAHREMIYARRRKALEAIAQPGIAANDSTRALHDLLLKVLGLDKIEDVDQALAGLGALKLSEPDQQYLANIARAIEPTDWSRVYEMLEIAQRNREDFKDPVAEKVEWRNLYAAADARAVLAQPAQAEPEALPRWKTFGRGEQRRAELPVPEPVFGWAMSSPLLALAEGKRTIDLTLGFAADPQSFDPEKVRKLLAPTDKAPSVANFNPFQVQMSTAKGWIEPQSVEITWNDPAMDYPPPPDVDITKLRALMFRVVLSEDQPPLIPPTLAVHGIETPVPVLRLMLRPIWNDEDSCYAISYQPLSKLTLFRARLVVTVEGLASVSIRNDQTILDARKPFEPFGIQPATGSRFYFGHREMVGKKLDSLGFNITWMGVPKNLGEHYATYLPPEQASDPPSLANEKFTAKVKLADGKVLQDFPRDLTLFDKAGATQPVAATLQAPEDQGNPDHVLASSSDVTEWNRYFVWELGEPDFQHAVYPTVALRQSLAMAAAIANKDPATVVAATYQVNPPYTPKIKSLTVDYAASANLVLDPAASGTAAMRVFHVEPFGYAELKPEGAPPGCPFLPQYENEGELYIGLRNVHAPQRVSLLFQVAEGSANPDAVPEPVQWSYLSGNRWLTLHDGSLVADGTRGLINSGIVELLLKPAAPNTRLPGGCYWIRAAIARSSDSVCDLVAIHPNAVLASFADDRNAPEHLSEPLPAGRIAKLVTPLPGVAHIRQPYSSFGGKMAEQDASFNVRVSERLRHKQRALTAWDYERLVLEKFPQLYKVKCLRADPSVQRDEPGRIELIVIPDIRNRLPFNPFEPKAPVDLLRDIEAFLQDKTPPFATVRARNAHYVPVMVRCGVRFRSGSDEGYCRKRLNEELNRFLSPWAYDEGADIVIGGSIYANSIIDFLDGRDYVDYLAEFKLFSSQDDGQSPNVVPEGDSYHVRAQRPDDVLVAAREHVFDVISQADYRVERLTGINYMKVELDFVVAAFD
ncbi:MAG: baseplate J/gp47 family protein [Candidatus Accumulibacter sp.]|uniref:Baseplate J/gp47 family protein n=1 Tax=Candidatus Accumulibacter proximus TaxID=2954385 RepID=A0A935Q1B1_9PROT|nr:baseplate J/gp47 family protein [Candidatus Accumulibacter proximus]